MITCTSRSSRKSSAVVRCRHFCPYGSSSFAVPRHWQCTPPLSSSVQFASLSHPASVLSWHRYASTEELLSGGKNIELSAPIFGGILVWSADSQAKASPHPTVQLMRLVAVSCKCVLESWAMMHPLWSGCACVPNTLPTAVTVAPCRAFTHDSGRLTSNAHGLEPSLVNEVLVIRAYPARISMSAAPLKHLRVPDIAFLHGIVHWRHWSGYFAHFVSSKFDAEEQSATGLRQDMTAPLRTKRHECSSSAPFFKKIAPAPRCSEPTIHTALSVHVSQKTTLSWKSQSTNCATHPSSTTAAVPRATLSFTILCSRNTVLVAVMREEPMHVIAAPVFRCSLRSLGFTPLLERTESVMNSSDSSSTRSAPVKA